MNCDFDVVLYFYDELEGEERAQATAHVRGCAECRHRLEELETIKDALASRPVVDAPPARDWSGFMRRLDEAVKPIPVVAAAPTVLERRRGAWTMRHAAALAAMAALVTIAVMSAARFRSTGLDVPATSTDQVVVAQAAAEPTAPAPTGPDQALRAVSAEHLERSKLVVLGLATRDPHHSTAADWQYERRLAGSLLSDTRLYRIAAQDRGVSDVARVMRDLETVLLEASLSDSTDKDALERVQRLIAKRDLVVKMQVMAGSSGL
jgi:hypothetical protein